MAVPPDFRDELRAELEAKEIELDEARQQLFEGSRALGLLSRDLHNSRLELDRVRAEVARLKDNLRKSQRTADQLKKRQAAMARSTSWRVTRPLRVAARVVGRSRKAKAK